LPLSGARRALPGSPSATKAVRADTATLGGIGPDAFTRQTSSATAGIALLHLRGTAREWTLVTPREGYLLAIASASVTGLLVGEEVTD
jgi:hypothetical protein